MDIIQQKIYLSPSNASFIELPPAKDLVNKLPNKLFRYHVTETIAGYKYTLEYAKPLTLPALFYGDIHKQSERVLKAYSASEKNVSILLHGLGGTGKSTLAKLIANKVLDQLELPVIIIQQDGIHHLEWLLNKLNQPVMFLIDEFEKMFDNTQEQGKLLTLFDGLYNSHHLFVLTANEKDKINEYFFNRPSRIRYAIQYGALTENIYSPIVYNNFEQKRAEELLTLLAFVPNLSFDILSEIMYEAQTFPELSGKELFEIFNLGTLDKELTYKPCTLLYQGKDFVELIEEEIKKEFPQVNKINFITNFAYDVSLKQINEGYFNLDRNELVQFTIMSDSKHQRLEIYPNHTKLDTVTHNHIILDVSDLRFTRIFDKLENILYEILLEQINNSKKPANVAMQLKEQADDQTKEFCNKLKKQFTENTFKIVTAR